MIWQQNIYVNNSTNVLEFDSTNKAIQTSTIENPVVNIEDN